MYCYWKLVFLLFILDTTGGPKRGTYNHPKRIPIGEKPPVVPRLNSAFCGPIQKCPDTEDIMAHRLHCFDPSPQGYVYHCGHAEDDELVEFFYRKFPCSKGDCGTFFPLLYSYNCNICLFCCVKKVLMNGIGEVDNGYLVCAGPLTEEDKSFSNVTGILPWSEDVTFCCQYGFYGAAQIQDDQVFMTCKVCPEDRFNPELRWSPENMDECRSHYHKAPDEHAIEYIPGNSTHPAVSYCNNIDYWASANEEMFCKEAYKPCECVYKKDSCPLLELLPDGSCVPWCDGKRSPENSFHCEPVVEEVSKAEISSQQPLTRTMGMTQNNETTNTREMTSAYNDLTTTNHNNITPGQILSFVIPVIIVFVITVIVCFKCRNSNSFITCITNNKNVTGNYINVKGNIKPNVTLNGDYIESSSDSE